MTFDVAKARAEVPDPATAGEWAAADLSRQRGVGAEAAAVIGGDERAMEHSYANVHRGLHTTRQRNNGSL